ncbi:MAG: multiheme c-type cytochrome [Planctomycetota bacterium]
MNDQPPWLRRRPLAVGVALLTPLLALCERPQSGVSSPPAVSAQLGPRLRMRISGNLEGRLEPCGCASGQLGGLARRAFYLQQDRNYDLLIEGGNAVKDGSPLESEKLATALSVLDLRGYAVLGLGENDFLLPPRDLAMYLQGFAVTAVASDLVENAPVNAGEAFPSKPYRDHEGAVPARIASLVMHLPTGDAGKHFSLLPPERAWSQAMAECPAERLRILLVHGNEHEVRAAAGYAPRPDLVVGVSQAFNEPPGQPETVNGVPVVFTGIRGRMLLDVTLARRESDGTPELTRYEVVGLAGSKTAPGAAEDRETRAMILDHRHQVQTLGLRERMAEQKPAPGGRRYVGSDACADCHEAATKAWKASKHAQAWATLEKAESGTRYGWPVTAYPDCVGCHVVGYGERSGFVNADKTPGLRDVGCEACHGPGDQHIEAYAEGLEPKEGDKGFMGRVGPHPCLRCHDFEQSPTFVFNDRWKEIEHGR